MLKDIITAKMISPWTNCSLELKKSWEETEPNTVPVAHTVSDAVSEKIQPYYGSCVFTAYPYNALNKQTEKTSRAALRTRVEEE